MTVTLPWPPTINTYWRRHGNTYFISKSGKNYRDLVCFMCFKAKGLFDIDKRLSVSIIAHPPDKRRRDLDNILKCLLDSMQHAGVYSDDNQIDKLYLYRNSPNTGQVLVTINEC